MMTRSRRVRSRSSSEEGAVAITTALLLIILILFAGLIVDLGRLRVDRSADQLVADFGVTAAVQNLELGGAGPESACVDAFRFALRNLSLDDTAFFTTMAAVEADCATNFATFNCASYVADPAHDSPAFDLVVQAIVREYRIVVTYPVHDDNELMSAQGIDPGDGARCDRIGVAVTRTADFVLGDVAGFTEGETTVSAVARSSGPEGQELYATLILLDRTNCRSLVVSGGSKVLVRDLDEDNPGLITLDSEGSASSCGNGTGNFVVVANGTNERICAGLDDDPGILAALTAAANPAPCPVIDEERIYTPSVRNNTDTYSDDVDDRRIAPRPVVSSVITRVDIDHRFNCWDSGSGNYPVASAGLPYWPTEDDIPDCKKGRNAVIRDLATNFGTGSSFASGDPDWITINSTTPTDCRFNSGTETVGDGTKNIFMDCDTVRVDHILQLRPKDYVVIRGHLEVRGTVDISGPATGDPARPTEDVVLVLQNGTISTAGNPTQMRLNATSVYLHTGSVSATLTKVDPNPLSIGDEPVYWTATRGPAWDQVDDPDTAEVEPTIDGLCDYESEGEPEPECLEDLALWSNNSNRHVLKGYMYVEGIFFTPNAGRTDNVPFDLSGGAAQPMDHAQFFSYRIEVSGGSAILMRPDPTRIEPIPQPKGGLIR